MLQINHLTGFGVGGGEAEAVLANHLGGGSSTSAGQVVASLVASTTVGRRGLLLSAGDNAGTNGASCYEYSYYANNIPQTATGHIHVTNDPGAASAGVTLAAASAISQLASQAIGSRWANGVTATCKCVVAVEVYTASGAGVSVVESGSNTGTGTNPSITTTGPLYTGDLMVAFVAQEARTVPSTPDAGFTTTQSAIADTTVAGTSVVISYQTFTATADLASKTYSVTLGASRDYAVGYVLLRASS